jgi:hypothetical protein
MFKVLHFVKFELRQIIPNKSGKMRLLLVFFNLYFLKRTLMDLVYTNLLMFPF